MLTSLKFCTTRTAPVVPSPTTKLGRYNGSIDGNLNSVIPKTNLSF